MRKEELEEKLHIAKEKKNNDPNPIFDEVKRVENLRNQVMGIKEDVLEKKALDQIDESLLTKALNSTHKELLQSRSKKIDVKKELLK
ncbi:hypothetical protein C0585_01485 [Candidatus Woesearchaeota archaeon]|nr:MAG: hypothetical protein C0585_01485 [Candidatus Woesearchaeota archaeon]